MLIPNWGMNKMPVSNCGNRVMYLPEVYPDTDVSRGQREVRNKLIGRMIGLNGKGDRIVELLVGTSWWLPSHHW